MKIGLIDVDSHNFPNLPLMKLSAHHKENGDTVDVDRYGFKWKEELLEPIEERRRVEVEEKYINDLMVKIETLEKEIKELKGELLPCPFCGGKAIFDSGTFAVGHDPNCYLVLQRQNAVSKINSTPKQCVEAWNRRV